MHFCDQISIKITSYESENYLLITYIYDDSSETELEPSIHRFPLFEHKDYLVKLHTYINILTHIYK